MLILASASPRRRDLLSAAGIPHTVSPVDIEERFDTARPGASPSEIAIALAVRKALAAAARVPGDGRILAADTIVVAPDGGGLLAKAATEDEARAMLAALSGRSHTVVTGVALASVRSGEVRSAAVESEVHFRALAAADVDAYISTGLWRGKAGAYGVQDEPSLVASVDGSRTNVVGLPMELVKEWLRG
jgi:septum formation protein